MPIASGQVGAPGFLGYPRNGSPGRAEPFRSAPGTYNTSLSGVTRDATGAPLGGCTVQAFRKSDDSFVAEVISDGSGNYSISLAPTSDTLYLVAYRSGAPDVAGTTVNTLVGV